MINNKSYGLIIGIDYKNTEYNLDGCQFDAYKIKNVLINKLNYNEDNILMLIEDDSLHRPTYMNIINSISKLIIKSRNNEIDNLFIYYSGHGTYIMDDNNDELDKQDEAIVPLDVNERGFITDDVLHNYFKYIPEYCKCFILFDCCHSGTLLDLQYRYVGNNFTPKIENIKSQIKANIIMISGCQDDEVSITSKINNQYQGILTKVFVDVLEKKDYHITLFDLLNEMRKILKNEGYSQYPQLTSNILLNNTYTI